MIIRLKVFEQTLSIVDTKSVPRKGSKDYLVLHFLFSSDWKNLDKICYLQHGEVSQPIDVVDNLVEVPEWFTQQDSFDVTLFGKSGGKEVPTNVVSLRLQKSNTLWEKDAPEPQPSWLAKVIDLSNHPPVPGENGYWLIWDTDNGAYAESELPLPPVSGAGVPDGGTAGQLLGKTETGTEWVDPPQSGVQSDWNQNDDTQPDYVKNRPFYTGDPVETVLLEDLTAEFTENDGVYSYALTNPLSLETGQTYQVSWDGTVYECSGNVVGETVTLGNLSIINAGKDTGEPFIYGYGGFLTADTSASHTISISRTVVPIVKIDEKYFPTIPAPVIEFTTSIEDNIANETQPDFLVVNMSYSEILNLVEKGSFLIKDSLGVYYRPIRTGINSSGSIFVDILHIGSSTTYAHLLCSKDKTYFYRDLWWQIEATKK